MALTEDSLRQILGDQLNPMRDDLRAIRESLYGHDGRGGVVADLADTKTKAGEHQLLLRGKDGKSGIVADLVAGKRIFKFLGAGGIIGAAGGACLKLYREIFPPG